MKTARILITTKCNRTCHYCCNEKDAGLDDAVFMESLEELDAYDAVVISGGEPMLYPKRLRELAKMIKGRRDIPIYLQSATCTKYTDDVLQYLDGITYTVHEEAALRDVTLFQNMQDLAMRYTDKTFRLNVHDNCKQYLPICANAWHEIRFFHHKDVCPVPANETLFVLNFEV